MNAGQLAALIAAGFFAVLVCVVVFVLLKTVRLMGAVTGMVTEYRDRADQLIEQAQQAVDRTNSQLTRTDAITASMDQVTANMAELSGHVSSMAGLARSISSVATAPVTGFGALLFGLRRALLVRRTMTVTAAAESVPGRGVTARSAATRGVAEPQLRAAIGGRPNSVETASRATSGRVNGRRAASG